MQTNRLTAQPDNMLTDAQINIPWLNPTVLIIGTTITLPGTHITHGWTQFRQIQLHRETLRKYTKTYNVSKHMNTALYTNHKYLSPVHHRKPPSIESGRNKGKCRIPLRTNPVVHIAMQQTHWKNTPVTRQKHCINATLIIMLEAAFFTGNKLALTITTDCTYINLLHPSEFNVVDVPVRGLGWAHWGKTFTGAWGQSWPDALPATTSYSYGYRRSWTQACWA